MGIGNLAFEMLVLDMMPETREFRFANGSLHTEQQPIINLIRVIDTIRINQKGTDNTTKLQQRMPACQA
nr:hypothetical protein [uncultured Gammaproteobacteria bacterium]